MNKKFSLADTFALNVPKSVKVTGKEQPAEHTPHIDPGYHFRDDLLRDITAWWELAPQGEALYLTGPTGSGKSSLVKQFFARLNWPVQIITGHESREFSDFVGRPAIQADGSMTFQYGPLATAMKYGHVFLLNEIDLMIPGEVAGLNGIIEGEPLTIPENGGEVIFPDPNFRFVCTGNSAGDGDDGTYFGVNRMNLAFLDRFWFVYVDYPDPAVEKKMLINLTEVDEEKADLFLETANTIRDLFKTENLDVVISTRNLLKWARMSKFFYAVGQKGMSPVHYALDRALLFHATPKTRESVTELVQRIWGEDREGNRNDN